MKLIGWVFAPSTSDIQAVWVAPVGYIRAQVGEMRLKPSTDTPMTDPSFEPGWKRAAWLDQQIYPAEWQAVL